MKFLVFLFILLRFTESYKILVVYPLYIKSLNILGQGVVRHLLNDGHEVTFITTHPSVKQPNKNLREIDVSSNNIFKFVESMNIYHILENVVKQNDISEIQELARENCRMVLENENVTNLLEDTSEHFDAVIADLMECEVYSGLAVLYNCPMIWFYSMGAHWQVLKLITDPGNPAYDADYLGTNIPPFTFAQRIEELWMRIKWSYYKTFITTPVERNIYEETFGPLVAKSGRELPDYEDVVYNASMIFGNEHNAIYSRPNTPQNFKYIGGIHIEEHVKPLPKNLQDLMDNAPHGVVYFSMGSLWESKTMPATLIRAILDTLEKVKQTIIWKYEDDLTNLPKNVHIVRWAPQQSILAHPKCVLFITHGGLLSTSESIYFGVPIIGIPVTFDQFININKAVAAGYAIKVDLNYDLPKKLKSALNVMLNDETFSRKAKELSSIHHDVPTKPGAELVHWVRHVVRTQGARHLRSPAIHVPLYQRLYLDLVASIIGIFIVLYLSGSMILAKMNKNVTKLKKQ